MTGRLSSGPLRVTDGIDSHCVIFVSRYCSACWQQCCMPFQQREDATQAVFAVLLERVPDPADWVLMKDDVTSSQRQELARAVDRVKKRHVRAKTFLPVTMDVADADSGAEREHGMLWAAVEHVIGLLSAVQQRIIRLTRDGWSVPEIAAEIGRTREVVSDEKYKAIKKLRAVLAAA